jgi:hypothetical protein
MVRSTAGPDDLSGMKKLLVLALLLALATAGAAQTVHEYASVEFSPGIRKLGVFSTAAPSKVIDLKTVHMGKRELDMLSFFKEVQDLEGQGWQVLSQDVVALDKGVHLYVWTLRRPKS